MKNIILFLSGKQGAGKTALADDIGAALKPRGWLVERHRFSRALYEIHDAARTVARDNGIPFPDKFGPFLQLVGTELFRKTFGQDVWVNVMHRDIANAMALAEARGAPTLIVVDDLRFQNEFDAFHRNSFPNAIVVKLRIEASTQVRYERCPAWRPDDAHPSEIDLDERVGDFDFVLDGHKHRDLVLTDALAVLGHLTPVELLGKPAGDGDDDAKA